MKCKGFAFTVEAIVCLCVVLSAILILQSQEMQSARVEEFVIQTQAQNILHVWSQQKTLSWQEMQKDVQWMFPGQAIELQWNQQRFRTRIPSKTKISVSTRLEHYSKSAEEITLTVYVP